MKKTKTRMFTKSYMEDYERERERDHWAIWRPGEEEGRRGVSPLEDQIRNGINNENCMQLLCAHIYRLALKERHPEMTKISAPTSCTYFGTESVKKKLVPWR